MAELLILIPSADACHGETPAFEAKLRARYQVAPIGIQEQDIIAHLSAPVKPKAIIWADGSLIPDNKPWLVEPLLAYLDAGGTLILAYDFHGFNGPPKTDRFLRNQLGLRWTFGEYSHTTCGLLPAFRSAFQSPVPGVFNLNAIYLRNVDPDARVYAPQWGNTDETAVAFQRYTDKGFIGYVGDIEKKEDSQDIIIAMLDRVIKFSNSTPLAPDAPEFKPAKKMGSGISNRAQPQPTGREEGQGSNPTQQSGAAKKAVECDMCGDPSTKWCAGCEVMYYCSVECQRADWPSHKPFCKMFPVDDDSDDIPDREDGGGCGLAKLFQGPGSLFVDTSVAETIRRLVDVYRLRTEDMYSFGGEMVGLYELLGGVPRDHFKQFLRLAESRAGLLPDWWDASARQTCLKVALDEKGRSFIGHAVEKSDIQEAYDDPFMPLAMRRVGEVVYGSPVGPSSF